MALGPKYYNVNGIWALKPYYLGPWTLRECLGFRLTVETPRPMTKISETLKPKPRTCGQT